MDSWHATFLGLRHLPREVTGFEIEVFFQFSAEEARIIEERRRPELKLGLALQIGFLRMSGRLLDAVRMVPPLLWRHLGERFSVAAPDLASLRAMYRRAPTLIEHQQLACEVLGFQWLTGHHRRALVRVLRQELSRTDDRERLLGFARRWLYEHQLLIVHERLLRSMIAAARRQHEAQLAQQIDHAVEPSLMMRWRMALTAPHGAGSSLQTWLWSPPAKHSSRQIEEMIERIESLYELRMHERMGDFPDDLLRRYARRLAGRPPSAGALIHEPARSVETACFLRYCLLLATDRLLMMVRRQVADLWRRAATGALATHSDWAVLYQELLAEVGRILADPAAGDGQIREHLHSLLAAHRARRPASRAELIRGRLIDGVRPVRSLLSALVRLPWAAMDNHPVLDGLRRLQGLYAHEQRHLPVGTQIFLGRVWQEALNGADRERAFCAFEVATLLALRRALRNGTVWIDHSLAFRSRERLFIPSGRWAAQRRPYFRRLGLPTDSAVFLEPLVERAEIGMAAVAAAAKAGTLRVDDELHLTPLAAEEEDPEVAKLRTALDRRIGEAQLPELILSVDADVRFSWIMLGREPRSTHELLMVYAGILGHGTALSAAETARMIPQVSAPAVRQAMRWAADERRLAEACGAVLAFMHRHAVATTWGRSDLASSDMMSLETTKRVWQARLDPRRQTPSMGLYSHVRDRWGIFHAQPLILNDQRQAGAAIEGVVRHEELDITQLAVDTHGHTDFAMALAKLLGFDLCPRLKALKDRHLFLPRGTAIPASVQEICRASVDLERIRSHWEQIVHLVASVHSGHTSATHVTARFGSASRGDPLYEAIVHLGRLLRTVFLCDYFLNDVFRRELLRVLNRGEAVNALKRAIYTGRIASRQAKQSEEMQAVADALSLLAISSWPGTPPRCNKSSITGPNVAAVPSRPSSSDASRPPERRESTCVGYSDSRSSAMSTKFYRLSLPRQPRREAREEAEQSRDFAHKSGSEPSSESDTCTPDPRGAREIYPPATVCYCTENERTPHWLFFINLIPGIFVATVVPILVRVDRPNRLLLRGADYLGMILMALSLGCLEYTLEEGERWGWFSDSTITTTAWIAGLAGIAFVWRSLKHPQPILDFTALKIRNFGLGSALSFVTGIVIFATIYLTPLFLGRVRGFSAMQIGLAVFSTGLFQIVAIPLYTYLARRIDTRWLMMFGFACFVASMWMFSLITHDWGWHELLLPQALRGFGQQFALAPVITLSLGSLAPQRLKLASGLFNLMRNLGGAIGIAVCGTLLNDRTNVHFLNLSEHLTAGNPNSQALISRLATVDALRWGGDASHGASASLRQLWRLTFNEAQTLAFADTFLVIMVCLVAAMVTGGSGS